ncbi:glycerophosphoryl diester phosphodiesterase [Bacillus mesophilus]|uniref:Glycerophosphodiester phosphodiesterase n=1 Tax=Bacillus mesophilus TaxID=1808955 RepID=A0A6M0Q5A7_9BACI|nr:glycerophosphodiester phosphodiesterase [Bacillus mesophilus]MBM7660910.1 glycerophosphoryl diester phosphodiesterase [Bacillus mesophilus]NEY71545.1 glycerophosphodiester phosphodiesterase [Bacillus mesophilus]
MTKIFGHRGAAGTHPENTMISFQEVEKLGGDGIELDVQLSKDGVVVVIHDEKLDRTTTGEGWVKDHTLKELRRLDASYKFPELGVCKIPTLDEVFNWALSNSLSINVELKNSLVPYEELEAKVIALIRTYRYENRVIISSFNHHSLKECHKLAPDISLAVLYGEPLMEPWEYAKNIGANSIHPQHRVATDEIITKSQQNGIPVRPYTVNNPRDMKRLFSVSCDALITDYPKRAIELKSSN